MALPSSYPPDRAARRDALFCETPRAAFLRNALGIARALQPGRAGALPVLARLWLAERFGRQPHFPDARSAPERFEGLCGIARDLSPATLIEGYRRGLHAGGHAGPAKWWSPPQRAILSFENFHMTRRLRARLRQERHRVTFDCDFEGVIAACAAPRAGKRPLTWITPAFMRAYATLFDLGTVHSFEVWNGGELVGGGYGVAIGGVFIIESQFARESHASKIGFAALNWHLAKWDFAMCDNKGPSQNVLDFGFHVVPRAQYLDLLAQAVALPGKPGRWEMETDLRTIAAWEPRSGRPGAFALAAE